MATYQLVGVQIWNNLSILQSLQPIIQSCVTLTRYATTLTLELRSRALARATSCFCPADKGAPPSARVISSPRGFDSTTLAKWARLRAAHMSMSLCRSKGSRLLRMVPVNNTGTCTHTHGHRYTSTSAVFAPVSQCNGTTLNP